MENQISTMETIKGKLHRRLFSWDLNEYVLILMPLDLLLLPNQLVLFHNQGLGKIARLTVEFVITVLLTN